jgi:hypothetical protein
MKCALELIADRISVARTSGEPNRIKPWNKPFDDSVGLERFNVRPLFEGYKMDDKYFSWFEDECLSIMRSAQEDKLIFWPIKHLGKMSMVHDKHSIDATNEIIKCSRDPQLKFYAFTVWGDIDVAFFAHPGWESQVFARREAIDKIMRFGELMQRQTEKEQA